MWIRRIAIENFRKLAAPLCLAALGDGLTVIVGNNEEGKSTVVEAIRAALFCRHRATGAHVDGFAPFDCSGAQPRVALDFAINGSTYRLRKAFCRRPYEAVLEAPGQSYEGDAAEDELSRLLGFAQAHRGALPAEEQGVWGLFWIEQGRSFDPGARVGAAGRATLTRALEDEVGRILGGDSGRALAERIRQRCEALFSPGVRSVPRGGLKLCIDRTAKAEGRLADLEGKLATFNAQVEELERIREERLQIDAQRAVEKAEASMRAAQQEQARIAALQARLERSRGHADLAAARLDAARAPWQQRRQAAEAADVAAAAAAELQDALAAADASHAPLQERLARCDAEVRAAEERLGAAKAACLAADQALQRARAVHARRTDAAALARAEAAARAVAAAEEEAGRSAVDDAAIARLRQLAAAASEARMRLDAAETVVSVAPDPGRRAFAGDREVSAAAPLRLSEAATLRLDGFGTITIQPGGADLAARQQAAEDAAQALQAFLGGLGISDPAAAEASYACRREALATAAAERRALAAAAPSGVAALRQRMLEHEQLLAALPGGAGPVAAETPPLPDLQAALRQAGAARDEARQQRNAVRAQRETSWQGVARAEQDRITLQARSTAAAAAAREQHAALAQQRAQAADATLKALFTDAQDDCDVARHRVETDAAALRDCDLGAAAARLQGAMQALATIQARVKHLDDMALKLQGELRGLGQLGLEEELAAARADHAAAQWEHAAVERRAAALKLLHQMLRDAEAQARSQFEGPIAERMAPYLEALFPGSTLVFAPDTLQLRSFRRNGVEEPFERLSIGTREQLAVLMRLAFAELLAERGQPAAVILDDALVYADRERLSRMQDILIRAAARMQILVLTCRADDYARLAAHGVPFRRLADCRPRDGQRAARAFAACR